MEIKIKSPSGVTLLTEKKYCTENISVVPELQDKSVTPATTEQAVSADTGYAGLGTVTVSPVATESGAATPSVAAQVITPSEGKLFDKFTVNATPTETKSVTPTTTEQTVTPTEGKFLSSVGVAAIEVEEKTATPTAAAQDVTPSTGKYLSKVTVNATPTEQKTITGNGTFTPSTGKFFDSVTVNVNTAKPEQEKSVELTTMTPIDVTPDEGYTLSKVTATPKAPLANTADATAAAGDILSGKTAYVGGAKVTGTIALADAAATPALDAQELTPPAGTYYKKVTVAATPLDEAKTVTANTIPMIVRPSEGMLGMKLVGVNPTPSMTKTVTPTTSAQTVTPDEGKLLSSVTVNAAPLDAAKTATAGTSATTVNPTGSNIGIKSVTVNPTPSSAKTVTPTKETQTVSPDSGKLLSGVTVNPIPDQYIIPSGTKDITANGTTDVTSFASVNVNVPAPDLSDATATAGKVLLGFTAYTGAGKITGTIPTYDGSLRPDSVMPVKGDIITIESKQYRVLKITKTTAEILAMYNSTTSQKFDASGNDSNVYANSSLDVYLSQTFYNSLSTTMQNALVAKTFQQDSWKWSGGTSAIANYAGTYQTTNNYTLSLMSTTYGSSISRKCYVLSCQDVIDYLEVTTSMGSADTTLTSENVWRMFWNQTTSPGSTYPWLRSAFSGFSYNAFCVSGSNGSLGSSYVGNAIAVRPAFQIDLSKVEFTK